MNNLGLGLYLLFTVSWFLHLGTRIPILGAIRIDFILIAILTILAVLKIITDKDNILTKTDTDKWLKILIIYIICSIPFVEWPGSVINNGIEDWVKAIVFYYFTIAFICSERDIKLFIFIFIACQAWRVLEPLYLHITEGYWGSKASMAGWESMDRLAGAPSDIVNPNGLAFIICTIIPFLYFMAKCSWKNWLASIILIPLALYALMLTGSRSGFLGIIIIFCGIVTKSRKRLLIGISGILLLILSFPFLNLDMQDRYLSIVGAGPKNQQTAEGRWAGIVNNVTIGFRKPIFGHGLGTSREANANFGGGNKPAHDLYAEVFQELGIVGLLIFILFIRSIFKGFYKAQTIYNGQNTSIFLKKLNNAMQVWLIMNLTFSFFSYGLKSYEWYLFAGFSVVIQYLAGANQTQVTESIKPISNSHSRKARLKKIRARQVSV